MKIIYRLEIEYNIYRKNKNPYYKIDNYIFKTGNSIENRKDALNKLESFEHIFELANKETENLKLSMLEFYKADNIDNITIPNVNLYYSLDDFTKENEGILLYGTLLDSFEERIEELVEERKLFEKTQDIIFETEIIIDKENKEYLILKDSPINKNDIEKLK